METCNQQFSDTWGTYICQLLKGHDGLCQRPIALIPDEGAREAWLQAKHLLRNADENPSLFILRTASFLSADEKYIATLTTELAEARRELPKCEGCLPPDSPDEMCPIHGKKAFEWRHQLNESYEYQEQLSAQLARANAVIERVVALVNHALKVVDDSIADVSFMPVGHEALDRLNRLRGKKEALETVRRTILGGNGA